MIRGSLSQRGLSLLGLMLALWAPVDTPARDFQACTKKFEHIIEHESGHFLDEDDLLEIERLFAPDNPTPEIQKAPKLFEIVLNARLRKLDPGTEREVRELLKDRLQFVQTREFNGTFFFTKKGKIRIETPKKLQGTLLEAYFSHKSLIHEIEHAVLYLSAQRKLYPRRFWDSLFEPARKVAEIRFLHELGAMKAEFTYLNTIPDPVRNDLINALKKNDLPLDRSDQRTLLRWLRNSAPGREIQSYLEEEWKAGRYGKEWFRFYSNLVTALNRARAITLGAATYLYAPMVYDKMKLQLAQACVDMLVQEWARKKSRPHGAFWKTLCEKQEFIKKLERELAQLAN